MFFGTIFFGVIDILRINIITFQPNGLMTLVLFVEPWLETAG